jgi:hypothetical protein
VIAQIRPAFLQKTPEIQFFPVGTGFAKGCLLIAMRVIWGGEPRLRLRHVGDAPSASTGSLRKEEHTARARRICLLIEPCLTRRWWLATAGSRGACVSPAVFTEQTPVARFVKCRKS